MQPCTLLHGQTGHHFMPMNLGVVKTQQDVACKVRRA